MKVIKFPELPKRKPTETYEMWLCRTWDEQYEMGKRHANQMKWLDRLGVAGFAFIWGLFLGSLLL